jgi:hypothetical protein
VRRYIHENLCFRFVMLPNGAAAYVVESAIKNGDWEHGHPRLIREKDSGAFVVAYLRWSRSRCGDHRGASRAASSGWRRSAGVIAMRVIGSKVFEELLTIATSLGHSSLGSMLSEGWG